MQAWIDGRHDGHVDITSARGLDLLRSARLGLRRAGIAVEKECAVGEARQRRYRGFVRLVGGDDGKDCLGARQRLRRGRSAEHLRRRVIGSLRRPHFGIGELVLMS